MTIFVCKTCGRSLRSEKSPVYCYSDRMNMMENISDEDAVRMKLFAFGGFVRHNEVEYEFPSDVLFDPFTGETFEVNGSVSLSDFQERIMEGVHGLSK